MKILKSILKLLKKLFNGEWEYFNSLKYIKYFNKLKINDNDILIEPQQGRTINGSMFYILKELTNNPEYNNYNIYVALKKNSIDNAIKILEYNDIKSINIVSIYSKKYYKLMSTAKYLFTDTSFGTFFIKKEGQVILNTWHGTPLKCLGKSSKSDYYNIGNVQKNFIISDYLLYPNEYTRDHMISDYMLENICDSKVILAGYPRNTAFFDEESKKKIRKELNVENKQVLIYMPTWREASDEEDIKKNSTQLTNILTEWEEKLSDNQELYINLHPLDKESINFEKFKKIKQFPQKYETYQFLNIADCLITDYSSVFFDFAITKKKIILFCYDESEYLENRGLYFDYKELPFCKVHSLSELVEETKKEKEYDETTFLKKFCNYDEKDVTKKICNKIILNKEKNLKIEDIEKNNKENILIYTGNLARNGVTSSLRNLLSNIDTSEKNYFLTFTSSKISDNPEQLFTFPENVKYIATVGKTNMTLIQKAMFVLFKSNILPLFLMNKTITKVFKNEIKRFYGNIKFDTVIQFNGYEYRKILLYSAFECNKVIYVHSDMNSEMKTRKEIQHRNTLRYAYKKYDKVAIVNKDLKESTFNIGKRNDNICVANNIINYKDVLTKSKEEEIKFNDDTESNISVEDLNKVLEDKNKKKFITIGRFSPEKGHERLIKAFNKLYMENNDLYLIIIGGNGKKYKSTQQLISSLESKTNIITIKSIDNPYNILNKCDYFVLSSFYEGFGLVLAEADILGLPVISTDVIGPRGFLSENNGTLVEDSENGIYDGMKKLLNNEVKNMNIDYEEYNKNAIKEFYEIINIRK